MRYPVDLHLQNRPLDTISVAGVHFRVDPLTFSLKTQTLFSDQPTADGYTRLSWGQQPAIYAMSCTTGMGGLPALRALEAKVPSRSQGGKDIPVPFLFPNRFGKSVHIVYINSLTDSMSAPTPYSYFFDLVLEEYRGQRKGARVLQGITLPLPIPGR